MSQVFAFSQAKLLSKLVGLWLVTPHAQFLPDEVAIVPANNAQLQASSRLLVVGIAASAGGLAAMIDLLRNALCHKSMCYVVVSHVSRFRETELPDILARVSNLETEQIEDGMKLKACRLYTIPPNHVVRIGADGAFQLALRPTGVPNACANIFFESLAERYGANAIGVVLSGGRVGADGAAGVEFIHRAGGHTFAQDPATAEFPEMPRLSIDSGCVKSVLSPELIGHDLSLLSWVAEVEGELSEVR